MPKLATLTGRLTAYLKPADIHKIAEAYHFSDAAHLGQTRANGEPYISHPYAVAEILAGWRLDSQTLTAALLHDVVEDTAITRHDIGAKFGEPVAQLVDGVSKLDKMEFRSQQEAQAENFRKMLLAMSRDVRVMLIKLADRLHNMRTLDAVLPAKRMRVARETMEIYAPISNRLGLYSLYGELQDLSFRHLHPLRYRILAKAARAARGNRREVMSIILDASKEALRNASVEAQVSGREKDVFSIYKKMQEKHLRFTEVTDLHGLRVIVADNPACYLALGVLHGLYKPVPGKFKDYIGIPKNNGYQSLHTTVIGPTGASLEVQIRTRDMHRIAESGVASHWLYKSGGRSLSELQKNTHRWLQSLLDLQDANADSTDFLDAVKVDLFPDEVYVFSPNGEIFALPRGATAVDFAYAVHTDVGNRCVACKINNEVLPLRSELKNGDRVEIITAAHPNPNPAWLNYVKTSKARSQIRHFLKTRQAEESAALGERLLNQALRELNTTLAEIDHTAWERVVKDVGVRSKAELLTDIGLGKRLAAVLARALLEQDGHEPSAESSSTVVIHGTEGVAVQFAHCCRPIPGDAVHALLDKGQGLVVHVDDCPILMRARRADSERWIEVLWDPATEKLFDVALRIVVANKPGVLAQVAAAIARTGSNISNVNIDEEGSDYPAMHLLLQVSNRQHLASVIRNLRRVAEVVDIAREREHGTRRAARPR